MQRETAQAYGLWIFLKHTAGEDKPQGAENHSCNIPTEIALDIPSQFGT
jgi:hypothetical protein